MSRTTLAFVTTLAVSIASAAACSMGGPAAPSLPAAANSDGGTSMGSVPFQPEVPSVYVAKVKNVLVGLPPTDQEVKAVEADPTQLKSLIDGWMMLPQYQEKMMRFFELAFQQTQVSIIDYADQAFPRQADINASTQPLLVQNLQESFARTMLELNAEGQPLTAAMTTQRFMMTPALMELYAFFDAYQVDDAGKVTDRFRQANPGLTFYAEAAQGPIPIAETLDATPGNPNYMHWYDPDVARGPGGPGCTIDPIAFPASAIALHFLLYGGLEAHLGTGGVKCTQSGGTATAPQLSGTDFTAWKMVTVRQPHAGESPTAFYDLSTLRTTSELVLTIPRVGFFSTPAFFANWQTNTSNEMRVTLNQTLIVATGAAIDGTDPTVPSSTPGLDSAHAAPGSACFGCHQLLDPTRSILASTYSWNYHNQTESLYAGQKGLFAFQGVIKPVSSIADFGATLAQHPLVPQAWAEKLCYYVNSTACEKDDPELQRIVSVFQGSGFAWNILVRELLSSPLTTYASPTKTATDNGEVIAVSRRDHLCAALNARLGYTDVCGLDALGGKVMQQQGAIPEIVSGLPSDGYGRGGVAPVLPNQPTLFYRAGTENICEVLAAQLIDIPANKRLPGVVQWTSGQPDAAIADFVSIVMGLAPSDPRSPQAVSLLKAHFTSATQQSGVTPTDALRSTFVTACLAPSAVSIGM